MEQTAKACPSPNSPAEAELTRQTEEPLHEHNSHVAGDPRAPAGNPGDRERGGGPGEARDLERRGKRGLAGRRAEKQRNKDRHERRDKESGPERRQHRPKNRGARDTRMR